MLQNTRTAICTMLSVINEPEIAKVRTNRRQPISPAERLAAKPSLFLACPCTFVKPNNIKFRAGEHSEHIQSASPQTPPLLFGPWTVIHLASMWNAGIQTVVVNIHDIMWLHNDSSSSQPWWMAFKTEACATFEGPKGYAVVSLSNWVYLEKLDSLR